MTPVLTPVPSAPPTYSVGMAETFSWIPVTGAGRDLYAQAVYVVNSTGGGGGGGGGGTVNLTSIENKLDAVIARLNQQLGQSGFDFIEAGPLRTGNWNTITVVEDAQFSVLNATSSTPGNIINYTLPTTFTLSGPFTSIQLLTGAIIAYKQ
jgi:hypothetical protein